MDLQLAEIPFQEKVHKTVKVKLDYKENEWDS